MDSHSDNLPPIQTVEVLPANLPTKLNPVIGEKPNYFPAFIRTVSNIGKISIYYYDRFGIPSVEFV